MFSFFKVEQSILGGGAAERLAQDGTKTEVSELDLAVKEELICQALLVANPLPHNISLPRVFRTGGVSTAFLYRGEKEEKRNKQTL